MPCLSGRSTNDGLAGTKSSGRTNCSAFRKIFRRVVVRNAVRKTKPKTNTPADSSARQIKQENTVYTKDAIRFSLNLAEQAMFKALEKIDDIPLTFPTEEGGCHPLWVLGHLAFVEGLAYEMLAGGENPAAEWASLFAPDSI